jgi:hypothetical protein
MFKLLTAGLVAIALSTGIAGSAAAAPKDDHPGADILTLDCEGIGTLEVITTEDAVTGFDAAGQVYVAKRSVSDTVGIITTHDGETFPFTDSFEEGAKGHGFEDGLFECTFGGTFTEPIFIHERTTEFLNLPEEYIGTEATLEGEFEATVWVFQPGN